MNDLEKLKKQNRVLRDTMTYLLGYLWARDNDFKVSEILARCLKENGVESDYVDYIITKSEQNE